MAKQNSFDIVSEVDLQEVRNAVQQATKEVMQRYDLKSTNSSITFDDKEPSLTLESADEYSIQAVKGVLIERLVRRGVSTKALSWAPIEPAAGGRVRQRVDLQQGIPTEKAKEIVKRIKQTKLKVQAAIQGDAVRVTGAKRDDLQAAMALIRKDLADHPLSFNNFRD